MMCGHVDSAPHLLQSQQSQVQGSSMPIEEIAMAANGSSSISLHLRQRGWKGQSPNISGPYARSRTY